MLKHILKVLGIFAVIIVLGLATVYWYIGEAAKVHFDLDDMSIQIKQGKPIPYPYDILLDSIRPVENKFKELYYEKIFCIIAGSPRYPRREWKYRYSYSEDILNLLEDKKFGSDWTNLFDRGYVFSAGIETKVSAKEIRNFYFMNKPTYLPVDSSRYILCKGSEDVAQYRFKKRLEDLGRSEMIEVYVLLDRTGILSEEKLKVRAKFIERLLDEEIKN